MFLRSKKLALVVTVVLLMSLTGCAFKQFIYNRLDWVVMYQIDSYLDLDKTQKAKFKPVIAEAIAWLKKDKLPGAIAVIGKLEAAAKARKYDASLNKLLTDEADTIRKDLVTRYELPINELLMQLSPDQVDYLGKKLKKSNDKMIDALKSKDIDAEYDEIIEKQMKSVTEWYGDLDKEQKEYFFKTMRLTRPQIEKRLAQREKIQTYMIETLKSKDAAKIKAMVANFRDKGEVWADPEYLQYRNTAEERWEVYLKALHASLKPEQWQHLEGKLTEMRLELENMIAKK
jgi:hypothetical protein